MKKVISFKKELPFKTNISEISSISLEHTINEKENDLISGIFYVSGEYKMTETSINKESFNFEIPFDIALDSRYDTSKIKFDIDDFYYEIINADTLKVNIDVYVDGLNEIKEKERCIEEETLDSIKVDKKEEVLPVNDGRDNEPTINIENVNENVNTNENINTNESVNLFDNISNAETYSTYYVYIVKDGDTIDKILEEFKVTKEELSNYNDISNIKANDKLIIPTNNE
jgi:LysM repeat protein